MVQSLPPLAQANPALRLNALLLAKSVRPLRRLPKGVRARCTMLSAAGIGHVHMRGTRLGVDVVRSTAPHGCKGGFPGV
eukprot:4010488-Alexandrium_andersonii.AAC.1